MRQWYLWVILCKKNWKLEATFLEVLKIVGLFLLRLTTSCWLSQKISRDSSYLCKPLTNLDRRITSSIKKKKNRDPKKRTFVYMSVVLKEILKLLKIDTKEDRWEGTTLFNLDGNLDRVGEFVRDMKLDYHYITW